MDTKQKFQELLRKMQAVEETKKGKLRGGFTVLKGGKQTVVSAKEANNYGICTNSQQMDNNYGFCTRANS